MMMMMMMIMSSYRIVYRNTTSELEEQEHETWRKWASFGLGLGSSWRQRWMVSCCSRSKVLALIIIYLVMNSIRCVLLSSKLLLSRIEGRYQCALTASHNTSAGNEGRIGWSTTRMHLMDGDSRCPCRLDRKAPWPVLFPRKLKYHTVIASCNCVEAHRTGSCRETTKTLCITSKWPNLSGFTAGCNIDVLTLC